MTARAEDPLWADEQHDRAESWASVPAEVNESPAQLCRCGHARRGHHPLCNGHVGKFWCQCKGFVALVAEPECPNELDPVLCVWDDEVGAFIPEAGCPVHDPNEGPST